MAEIIVQDEGIGIPPDDLPRIFDRGSISVTSTEGKGSTFTLSIPVRVVSASA